VNACWDTYCSGWQYGGSQDYMEDQAYVGNYANDKFSALSVYSYNPSTDPYVMFYKSCAGSTDYSWFAVPQPQTNGYRDLFLSTLSTYHIGNDALSRIVISANAAIQLYQDDDYGGGNIIFAGPQDISCLTSTPNGGNWNDQVSSAKLWDLSSGKGFPTPVGSWVLQTSAGSAQTLNYQITYGYTTSDSTSSTSTFETSLTSSIEVGADFELGSVKQSLSLTVSYSLAQEVASSVTKATTVTCGLTCAANTCPPNTVTYLYTWQMQFQRPWESLPSTTLNSCNSICRCDSSPPQCALTDCSDSQCNTCKSH